MRGAAASGGGYGAGRGRVRPRYGARDLIVLIWRERLSMFAVFAVVFAVGAAFALTLPPTYTARASMLVKLGQEYVYEPRAGDAARGAIPGADDVVQSEVQILSSAELARRVVAAVGLATIDPKLADDWAGGDAARRARVEAAAVRVVERGLKIDTAPQTSVVRLSFAHPDPEAAAAILNAVIDGYLAYRREVFADRTPAVLERQRDAFEVRLAEADEAYRDFLAGSGVSDFGAERASLTAIHQSALTGRFETEARLREVRQRLQTLTAELAAVPREIGIHRDLNQSAPDRLVQLRMERQDLLSRYRPDSQPVRETESKIAELERLIASGGTLAEKDLRLGANPVWQELETERLRLEAEAASLAARRDELARQLTDVSARQLRLAALESEHETLAARRDVMQGSIRAFAAREAESRAAGEIAQAGEDNIRVVERARPPALGKSLRKAVFVLAFLFAAFSALCWGLLKVFTRRGLATAGSAGRTLDLPVLADAPLKS